ncbi:hypothetical protein COV49_01260 [Candidatus Falkowbacteria bacterium CG11_big_fil_rev_8_21_14_0_20_39_10]|uniref:Addiction module toxin, HicA family n=1 Tax=Candidatus Falkowbacteria bacterium CG11_big_fil_rev_8_21_14_0_20_39_10 TaxID=1974570 RepID=A0A2M6K9Q9_9BACT|nr:MAG: hypothetical protein COV49_01260 [Candidatus Falkowbacteria bacterium CG11_big_fil_rev_8_21_14_0_20_39_10]
MSKIPPLKAKKVIKLFLKIDFYIHHQTGSHVQLRHYIKKHLRMTIPRHDKFDLPPSIILNIIKQAEISRDEFLKILKK